MEKHTDTLRDEVAEVIERGVVHGYRRRTIADDVLALLRERLLSEDAVDAAWKAWLAAPDYKVPETDFREAFRAALDAAGVVPHGDQ